MKRGNLDVNKQSYEETWDAYWKEICSNPDGSVNLDQIKRELADYAFMLDEVPKVYTEVTGNTLFKPNYYANTVIGYYEDHVNELVKFQVEDIVGEIEGMKCGSISSEYSEALDDVIEFLKEEYQIEDREGNESV